MNKKLAFAALSLALLVAFALAVAGCGSSTAHTSKASGGSGAAPMSAASRTASSGSSGNTISVTTLGFTRHTITVRAGQPVVFYDLTGTHPVCVGTGTGGTNTCATASQAPTAPIQLVGAGTVLTPGHKVSFTFKPGTYHIISTTQPGMYIDVTVQ